MPNGIFSTAHYGLIYCVCFHIAIYHSLYSDNIIMAASFQAAPADEREMAMELLEAENVKGRKAIWLFDLMSLT